MDAVSSKPEATLAGERLSLPIQGLTCASCVHRVERAIKGVEDVRVNLAIEQAEIAFHPGLADAAAVATAIEQAGYSPVVSAQRLAVSGMICASCSGQFEKALKAVPGVLEAQVSLGTKTATVRTYPTSKFRPIAHCIGPAHVLLPVQDVSPFVHAAGRDGPAAVPAGNGSGGERERSAFCGGRSDERSLRRGRESASREDPGQGELSRQLHRASRPDTRSALIGRSC